jgi:hypothetical protein
VPPAERAPDVLSVDVSFFPLVLVRFPRLIDHAALELLKQGQERIYSFNQRYVSLVDMRGTAVMPLPTVRGDASDWTKAQEPKLRKWQVANALIVDSMVTRAGIQAVHWFAPPPTPTVVVGSISEGAVFLRGELRARAVLIDASARQMLENLVSS